MELDHRLHENPELKRAPYAWLADFVGWLPMPVGGDREAHVTADCNAEMIGHIARYPWVRDRAIFVGEPEDIVPGTFGPGLPGICEWTQEHYAFSGYVTLFDPGELPDRAALGYGGDERVCLVSARASANTCSTASARPPGGARARPGAADDRRHRAADRRGPSRPTAPHGRRR
jgi:hypothetical protein